MITSISWIVVSLLMTIVIILKHKGYAPVSGYGMALGGFVCWVVNTIAGPDHDPLTFEPEQFMYILLPPIVLFSGLQFKWEDSHNTIGTSMTFAWLGTVGTAAWVALGIWTNTNVEPWIVCFWIGSILSPTDPVGTLDLMKYVEGHDDVRLVLEHESLLNDAVAVMLVHTSQRAWTLQRQITKSESMEIIAVALGLAMVSFCVGAFSGWVVSKKQTPPLVIVCGMFIFSLCETLGASGIISLFVYGAVLSAIGVDNKTFETIRYISELSESYVYVTMGGVLTMVDLHYVYIGYTVLLACVVGRIINIFLFGYIVQIGGVKWKCKELIFMSSCGMRGAVSLALAVYTPEPYKSMFVTVTIMEVVFSMFYTTVMNYCLIHIL